MGSLNIFDCVYGQALESLAVNRFLIPCYLSFRFVETKRWMDIVKPGSQAAEDSFFGFEAAFEGLETG